MTIFKKYNTKCPSCGKDKKLTLWERVNGNLHPELAKKIIFGDIFDFKCPYCGSEYSFLYNMVYKDDINKECFILNLSNSDMNAFVPSDFEKYIFTDPEDFEEAVAISFYGLGKEPVTVLKKAIIAQNTDLFLDTKFLYMKNDTLYFIVKTLLSSDNIQSIPLELYKEAASM